MSETGWTWDTQFQQARIDELHRKYTDAQATIAALQARVQELETELGCPTWVCDCCGRVSSMGWINIVNETMDGIDYDMECPNCHTRQIEEDSAADLVRERDEFESQLTQRTAELEAANKLLYKKNCALGRAETIINDLQAKLERVRADNKALDKWRADVTMSLQRPEGAFFVDVPQHIKDLVAELERVKQALCDADERANEYQKALHDFESERALPLSIELERVRGERDHAKKMEAVQKEVADNQTWHVQQLRTLIAALPKVEGEIEVSSGVYNFILLKHDSGTRFLCGQIETEQTAKAIAALLKHRQGMEG